MNFYMKKNDLKKFLNIKATKGFIQARILASALFNNDIDVGLQDGHHDQYPEVGLQKKKTKRRYNH